MSQKKNNTTFNSLNKSIIKNFIKVPKQNFGNIVSINYGCAKVIGLNQAKIGERINCFKTNSIGSVVGIDPKYTIVLFYTNINNIQSGMTVFRSINLLSRNIKNIKNIFGNISKVID